VRLPAAERYLDPTLDLVNWTELGPAIAERHLAESNIAAVAALSWIEAGKLNYAIGKDIPVLCLCDEPHEFRYQHDLRAFAGKDILIVGTEKYASNPHVARLFARTQTLTSVVLHRASEPAIELTLIRGTGFRPLAARSEIMAGTMAGD